MRLLSALAVAAAVLVAGSALAADPVKVEINSVDEQPGRLAVTVNVSAADGRAITGLTAANFRATLNDTPVTISDVQADQGARIPTSVLLLIDVSGSMAGDSITQAKLAMQEFVRNLDGADQVSVIAFDSRLVFLQDYTTDRNLLSQAISKLIPFGDTALYDAIIEGTKRASEGPGGRKLIVLLTDGQATINLNKRGQALAAAKTAGISIVSVGLGPSIDRAFLNELSAASGGRVLEAPTPASLRQAYQDLAASVRSLYTVVISVPGSIDRTLETKLNLRVIYRADAGAIDRVLPPLAGAVPPPFELSIGGIAPGQRLSAPLTLQPAPATAGITLDAVEYQLDGQVVYAARGEPFSYALDPLGLAAGNHVLKITATDARGRRGEAQLPFLVPVPSQSRSLTIPPAALIPFAIVLPIVVALWLFLRRRHPAAPRYVSRIKPWATRVSEPGQGVEGWEAIAPPPPPPDERPAGRLVVMDEDAVRQGNLDVIMEYEMRALPLVLGTGRDCDVRLEDPEGRIAAEEARLWVQKGRLVYHKLTTLSAMATEGVTSGWQFLESGEEMKVGRYRILFQAEASEPEPELPIPSTPPQQDHGMALRDLWTRMPDDPSLTRTAE